MPAASKPKPEIQAMRLQDLKIQIRLALHDLGRDPYVALPRTRAALEAHWRLLRIEQARSARSQLRPEIKAAILARGAK
jgi:uncharacterized protein (DUF2267 family)